VKNESPRVSNGAKTALHGAAQQAIRIPVWECKIFTIATIKEYGSITTLQILHIFS
jgi:hypothetical protein